MYNNTSQNTIKSLGELSGNKAIEIFAKKLDLSDITEHIKFIEDISSYDHLNRSLHSNNFNHKKYYILGLKKSSCLHFFSNLITGNSGHFILLILDKNNASFIDPKNPSQNNINFKDQQYITLLKVLYDKKIQTINLNSNLFKQQNMPSQDSWDFHSCGYYCLFYALKDMETGTRTSFKLKTLNLDKFEDFKIFIQNQLAKLPYFQTTDHNNITLVAENRNDFSNNNQALCQQHDRSFTNQADEGFIIVDFK